MYGDMLSNPPGGPPPIGAPPTGAPDPGSFGAPPGAAQGVGMGAPPKMPGMPPPPTMTGAMPTGDPSTTAKEAADNLILAMRTYMGHNPSSATTLNPIIDQIKKQSKAPSPPKGALGAPSPPGQSPDTLPTPLSGSPGGF